MAKKSKYILLIAISAFACKSPARIAQKQEQGRQRELVQLQKVREQLPCIPVAYKVGLTTYLPRDTIRIADSLGKIIKNVCPPSFLRVDTLRLLDYGGLKAVRDSLASSEYYNSLKETEIKGLRTDQEEARQSISKAEKGRDSWRNIAIPALFALLVVSVLKLKSLV